MAAQAFSIPSDEFLAAEVVGWPSPLTVLEAGLIGLSTTIDEPLSIDPTPNGAEAVDVFSGGIPITGDPDTDECASLAHLLTRP